MFEVIGIIAVIVIAALLLAALFGLAFATVITLVFSMDTIDYDIEPIKHKETK